MSYSIITRTFVVYGSLCYFLFLLLYESVLVTVGLSSLHYNSSYGFFVYCELGGVEHESDPFVSEEGMLKVTERIKKLNLKFEIKEHNVGKIKNASRIS